MKQIYILLLLVFTLGANMHAQLVHEYLDLQIHPTMHFPYSFFGKGLEFFDENDPPNLSYEHQFNNVNYANFFKENKGLRIMAVGTLNGEYISNPELARKNILKQIDYVNKFAEENPTYFVVAKSPQQVRDYLNTTDKTIIIHCIEGGKELIKSQEDANFWAAQGVSFITLIHLVDGEYGGAAIMPGLPTRLINIDAPLSTRNEMGLTELGKNAIIWLANAGIMTDVTHMNDRTRKDALDVMEAHGIPPLSTHDGFKPIHNNPRALDEEDIVQIYKNNGFISLPISGFTCMPYNPSPKYQHRVDSLEWYCAGSVDSYIFTYNAVKEFIETHPALGYNDSLTEEEKINYCIGFQSDFNGWLNHSRPRYGQEGCYKTVPDSITEPIETLGLAHPGLLHSQWNVMEQEGVDLAPIKRAAEKFLQLWQYFIDHKGSF
jgi:microsomal dipeptidase-like Zn-dependent dipeptidase